MAKVGFIFSTIAEYHGVTDSRNLEATTSHYNLYKEQISTAKINLRLLSVNVLTNVQCTIVHVDILSPE